MITIEQHNEIKRKGYESITPWELSGIECPDCEEELYKNSLVANMSYPPKVCIKCRGCGYNSHMLM